MRFFGSSTIRDAREVVNPKPVGEAVRSHVHQPVKQPTPDFEKLNRIVRNPDVRNTRR
jgi:hypothetical protein